VLALEAHLDLLAVIAAAHGVDAGQDRVDGISLQARELLALLAVTQMSSAPGLCVASIAASIPAKKCAYDQEGR
jgi:hypothetical protein